jgi:hypothetical protein
MKETTGAKEILSGLVNLCSKYEWSWGWKWLDLLVMGLWL